MGRYCRNALMVLALVALATLATPVNAKRSMTRRVSVGATTPSQCGVDVLVQKSWSKTDGSIASYGMSALERWSRSDTGITLVPFGATSRAVWVLEGRTGSDACNRNKCAHISLREIRFNGRRARHVLYGTGSGVPADIGWRTAVHTKLNQLVAKHHLAKQLCSVTADTPKTSRSKWVMRIRNRKQRRSFVWLARAKSSLRSCVPAVYFGTRVWN